MAAAFQRSRPPTFVLSLSVLAAVAATACDVKVGDKGMSVGVARETLKNEWTRSYALASGHFDLSLVGGTITVTGSDSSQLDVRIAQEASGMTKEAAQRALDSVSIQEMASSDRVSLEVRQTDEGPRGQVALRATVRLPRGLVSGINIRNGEMRLEGVDGTSTAAATNGTIFGSGISGTLSASVVNGRLALDLSRVTAPMELTAKNGNINIGVTADTRADVEATALNGGISIDPMVSIATDTPRNDGGRRGFFPSNQLSGRLNGGGPKITIHVNNGAVRIGQPGVVPPPLPR